MKNIIIIFLFLLNFQSWVKANDITELEVEGISIGDSLLKIMSEKEIKDDMSTMYKLSLIHI